MRVKLMNDDTIQRLRREYAERRAQESKDFGDKLTDAQRSTDLRQPKAEACLEQKVITSEATPASPMEKAWDDALAREDVEAGPEPEAYLEQSDNTPEAGAEGLASEGIARRKLKASEERPVLAARQPRTWAIKFMQARCWDDEDQQVVRYWQGDWWRWDGECYRKLGKVDVEHEVINWLDKAKRQVGNEEVKFHTRP